MGKDNILRHNGGVTGKPSPTRWINFVVSAISTLASATSKKDDKPAFSEKSRQHMTPAPTSQPEKLLEKYKIQNREKFGNKSK